MRAKQFFYAAAGILLLVIAYSLGASRVQGQTPMARFVGITSAGSSDTGGSTYLVAITENGDWYYQYTNTTPPAPWAFGGSIPGAVPVQQQSWSGVKQEYRK